MTGDHTNVIVDLGKHLQMEGTREKGDKDPMRGEDKTIRVTPLEERKGDKEVVPGVDTRTEGEAPLETEENGLEPS